MTERQIWDYFLDKGLTPEGTAGLMGNLAHESGLRANNLQNSYEKSLGMNDETYTAAVDSGVYQNFVHDKAGYGLAQWTYWSRKEALYKYVKARGVSIGDTVAQLDFLIFELASNYGPIWRTLCSTDNVREASDIVLLQFERPADQSEAVQLKRYETSKGFYDRLAEKKAMGYTNSPLVVFTQISPNRNTPRNHPIDTITIHHMAGNLSIERCGALFASPKRQGSSNYGVGSDGRIGLYVPESDRAWTSGSPNNDHRAVTIEVANDGGAPDWHVSDAALIATINLVADICKRNGIKQLVWSVSKAGRLNRLAGANMTVHQDFQSTSCPGPYLMSLMPQIANAVNKILGSGATSVPAPAPVTQTQDIWRVQVGAFKSYDNARKQAEDLKAKGEDYIIVKYDDLYKVQVGAYSKKLNADGKAAELRAKGYSVYITDKGGEVISVSNKQRTYTVKPGDTLSGIARAFGTTVEKLQKANAIADKDLIYPGQQIVIE